MASGTNSPLPGTHGRTLGSTAPAGGELGTVTPGVADVEGTGVEGVGVDAAEVGPGVPADELLSFELHAARTPPTPSTSRPRRVSCGLLVLDPLLGDSVDVEDALY
ncbi:hypothetical protein [Streptomyces sp. SID13031]|uniref:hypothetical protein n=1 Tax=Streptomyces sp. SID13031 TaxID=2706046 RepID=UPI0013C6FB3D|nr:hypothetical protein [Streptomyces sp. SID13031]NEA30325.1 hypothetical protein [Streptomyces sp. SID13031]